MEGGVAGKHIPYSLKSIAELLFADTAMYSLFWLYPVMDSVILIYLLFLFHFGKLRL